MSVTIAASTAADSEQEQIEVGTHLDLTAASPTWQDVALRRRDEINNAIPSAYLVPPTLLTGTNFIKLPELSKILSQRELEITSLTATKLLERIHSETYTAVEVTTAFCKRSAIAHQATNCLAFILFEQALADALALDKHMATHHTPIGPLHGLPISVKEHVDLANTPSTSGFVSWADNIAKQDSLIVKVLSEAGAVFHVKTTNPQALMALETVSNLYGTTTNPHNTNLTPGGSSGGEGALIAMRGSLLGIGTDIGGSIRAPAAFSGIYGLKPSISRLPHSGLAGVHGGMENIIGAVGPMATSSEDLRLFNSVVLNSKPWRHEPSLIELPWRPEITIPKTLRIGIMYHDEVVTPHPPITRCLKETAKKLQNAGHVLIPWEPKCHKEIVDIINESYFLDGGEEYHEVLAEGNEPAVPLIANLLSAPYAEKHRLARDTWKINKRRNTLQDLYAREWNEKDLDFLLCPVNASVGSRHGESTYWGYTSVFNLLDYTGAVLPVGTVEKEDTWEKFVPGEIIGEEDRMYRDYYTGPERYDDAPVALQVVTRRCGEERALLFVEEIERVLGV